MSNGDDETGDAPEDDGEDAPGDVEASEETEEDVEAPEETEEDVEAPEETEEDVEASEETADDADTAETAGDTTPESSEEEPEEVTDVPATEVTPESVASELDEIEADVEAAETEADLDEVEARLDTVADDVEAADFPEPDDEDDPDPTEEIESRIGDLRGAIEEARGPYAEDVTATLEETATTVRDAEWTEDGAVDVRSAVRTFLETAGETLGESFAAGGDDLENHAGALEAVAGAVDAADLDADEDADTIATLLEAAEDLADAVEAAEEYGDLRVVEQLRREGFYDRLNAENRKDFPPELSVVRIAEAENDVERILTAYERFESDFMVENCLDALRRLGPDEAYEAVHGPAQKRKQPEIEVLGKIGDERAVETLVEFVDSGNPPLQKVTLRALGEIGSEESTQVVANALDDEEDGVRSAAARSLGLIGDTRAIEPLSDVLDDEAQADTVRTAAAWALGQIGTRRALEAAAEHDDDRSYTVQVEAERARDATAD